MSVRERTIVVGAGLTGLACATDLARAGHDVLVLEAAPRAGGVVGTVALDGFRFETGPHTVPAWSASFRRFAGDLGLAPRLIATGPEANVRWLWFRGRLVAFPRSPLDFVRTPLLSAAGKRALATEPFRRFEPPAPGAPEPTFEAFLTERMGREATRVFAGSFVRGVYAAEVGELGARSAFPRMWNLAARHHGLVRGAILGARERRLGTLPGPDVPRSALVSFPDGLGEIVDAAARALGSRLRLGARVERLERGRDGWIVHVAGSGGLPADHVVLATPAPVTAALLASASLDSAGFSAAGSETDASSAQAAARAAGGAATSADARAALATLRAVRHARVTVVHLGFSAASPLAAPRGFGFLVPPDEDARGPLAPRLLGALFASNLFPGRAPAGGTTVACFYRTDEVEADASAAPNGLAAASRGGRTRPDESEATSTADARVVDLAVTDLQLALALRERPRPATRLVRRWGDVIPRYEPGHDERVRALHERLARAAPGVHVAGAFTAGVSVDAVVARGRAVAAALLRAEARR